jgi:hypothetical protein
MTFTPATLLATADRYERHYGCRKGDGGTADQLRAGAEAMVECERLRAALIDMIEGYEEWDRINGKFVLRHITEQSSFIQRARAALQGDPK